MFEEGEHKMLVSSPVWEKKKKKKQKEVWEDLMLKKVLEDVTKDPLSRPRFHIH